ncbi:MAG: MBL fold metallo-hydrolase [Deltaproteobacteria bacterium]|nr:MAG: MBL fold metallo-hydrolase [Deltaproteobacteria bacterium]
MLRLTVLGSGDAFNGAGALHSAYLLEHGAGTMLLECGPSVLAGMKRCGIDSRSPDIVLVSHLHGDHFAGLPFLFLEYLFCNRRSRPLEIAGPRGIAGRVEALHASMYRERTCRSFDFPVNYRSLEPGADFQAAGFEVETFEVPHPAEPFSLGYRITAGGATLVFSGDSAWTDAFAGHTRDADLFLCECCSLEPASDVHISYREILSHRERLGARRILLTHLGADVREAEDLAFDIATDGMVVELGS